MATCVDCRGGTPGPSWKRCFDCAYEKARELMSEGKTKPARVAKRYARGARVFVNGEIGRSGTVLRLHDDGRYAVALDGGQRCYVTARDLSSSEVISAS